MRYVGAAAVFFVGLAAGAMLIWFILPTTITIQNAVGPLPNPSSSPTPLGSGIVAGMDKCQPLLDECIAYHDCVRREMGAAIADGLPDCPAAVTPTAQTPGEVILCFSPPVPADGCDPAAAVIHSIDAAERTIWLQTYLLTSQATVDSLLKAYGRHVAVSLIVDKQMLQEQPELVLNLAQAGVTVRVDASVRGAARSSVMIVDGTIALAGSFDFTNEAEHWNADDLIVTNQRALVDRYRANWDFHLAHSEPVKPSAAPGTAAPASPTRAPRRARKRARPALPPAAGARSAPGR